MREELSVLIQAEYPIIYVITHEEDRAEQEVYRLVQKETTQRRVFTWTVTSGFVEVDETRSAANHSTVSPEAAIEWVVRHREEGVYIFKDLHPFLDAPAVTRWLRDAIATFKVQQQRKTIILVSPVQRVPQELGTEVVVLDFALPSMTELTEVLEKQVVYQKSHRLSADTKEKLVKAALGLTLDEAQKVYRKAQVMRGRLTEKELDVVLSEKKQLIRRNGILDYMEELTTLDAVGGLDELKRWLRQRSNAFSESAREYGLPQPKGMLILGVPGCGKSLIAKTTSQLWGLPLLRLDMGRVYDGSMVGQIGRAHV